MNRFPRTRRARPRCLHWRRDSGTCGRYWRGGRVLPAALEQGSRAQASGWTEALPTSPPQTAASTLTIASKRPLLALVHRDDDCTGITDQQGNAFLG